MSPAGVKTSSYGLMMDGLWANNPIFRQVLGICSTLAITNMVLNTMVMCTALVWTTALSGFTVSLLRNYTPRNIRMMVQTLIIAFYVIIVDLVLKAYWPQMSRNLGPYVGLVITNCIVMGRCEAYAGSNRPVPAFLDGLYMGIGYSFILVIIAIVREFLGMGSFLGIPVSGFFGNFDKWTIMVMPPGAFFMLAIVVWIFRSIRPEQERAK